MWLAWLALAALTALRLGVAAVLPLSPDEAYYWVWSRALAPGYLDHPPMVALWIRAGTALAGDGSFGVRLLAPPAAALGSVLLAAAAADCFPGRRGVGVVAAALLNATLLLGAGAVTITPDTPLLLFWTLAVWALGRLLRTGHGAWWLLAGLAIGLAMDSKYSAFLLAVAVLLWLLVTPSQRRWLAQPLPWGGAVVAGLVFLPVLQWNARHGWVSFLKQGGRAGDWQPARAAQFLAELIAGQIGLATPLVFCACVAGVWAVTARARRDPAAGLLAVLTLLPAAVFLQHALGDRVQGNWPAVLYPTAAVAAAGMPVRWWRPAVASGLAITALVYLQAATGVLPLPPALDPTQRQLAGWPQLAAAAVAADAGARFIAADDYGLAAELARAVPSLAVVGAAPRWALFTLPRAAIAGQEGLLLRPARRTGPPDALLWPGAVLLGEVLRPGAAERYRLYRVQGQDTPDVVLLPARRPGNE
jgi:4-amino-4-deoxy-L-arabinose transferase-like glycosyltransferase